MRRKLLTPRDIAEDLGVSVGTVYYWLRTAQLKAYVTETGRYGIKPSDYQKFFAEYTRTVEFHFD